MQQQSQGFIVGELGWFGLRRVPVWERGGVIPKFLITCANSADGHGGKCQFISLS